MRTLEIRDACRQVSSLLGAFAINEKISKREAKETLTTRNARVLVVNAIIKLREKLPQEILDELFAWQNLQGVSGKVEELHLDGVRAFTRERRWTWEGALMERAELMRPFFDAVADEKVEDNVE